ncbi:PREDICTED: NADH dehydrogenase [ubiquinone] 1 beta subcomplex subunit 8, mitochondrial, partial [Ceratosolen solmsi marchali]|uniref:NADH dehydrogenase [ubiquinone] 1 beta subcomplex subunit 8, mitochondrial n=1 Tax=Ceratosolen solmsi marchali TaxID=326594 RepID=A0AAJ7DZR6_9HYME
IEENFKQDPLCKSLPKAETKSNTASIKYNLHKKEYDVYNENEYSYGDYPKLPFKGVELRDPHYPYDNPEHKRNFNEPVHAEIDMLGENRYSAGVYKQLSSKFAVTILILLLGSLYGSSYIFKDFFDFQPVLGKQYPCKEKIYYTFEKVN